MKKTLASLIVVISLVATLHAFRAMEQANITGQIVHGSGVVSILATNGIDSVHIQPIDGFFSLLVKPGNWKILVKARDKDKKAEINVPVYEGKIIDLGQIRLQ